jgi:hypothetical protein
MTKHQTSLSGPVIHHQLAQSTTSVNDYTVPRNTNAQVITFALICKPIVDMTLPATKHSVSARHTETRQPSRGPLGHYSTVDSDDTFRVSCRSSRRKSVHNPRSRENLSTRPPAATLQARRVTDSVIDFQDSHPNTCRRTSSRFLKSRDGHHGTTHLHPPRVDGLVDTGQVTGVGTFPSTRATAPDPAP